MKRFKFGLVATIFASVACAAHADYPVSLHIDAPNSNGGPVLESESGWPFTIKLVIDFEDMLGFAKHYNYANKGTWGFIVFEDDDGCPWMDDPDWRNNGQEPIGCPAEVLNDPDFVTPDEIYLEFRPDVDESGMPDTQGDAAELAELVDSAGSRGPEFEKNDPADSCIPGTGDADCVKMGPETGGETEDGWGIGSDDNLVGLFLYSEAGIGFVYEEPDFELTNPVGVRNLAGIVNSVSYDLSDLTKVNSKEPGQKGKPTELIFEQARIWAHVNMPRFVVRNVIQYDACVGNVAGPLNCDGDDLWRVDGSPTETPPSNFGWDEIASIWLLENTTFTVKAFMVSGHAPDMLFDVDGDGDYTDDAEAEGYTVISNVGSVDLLQLSNINCWGGGGNMMPYDLDDNGELSAPIICPTGPGDVTRPPR